MLRNIIRFALACALIVPIFAASAQDAEARTAPKYAPSPFAQVPAADPVQGNQADVYTAAHAAILTSVDHHAGKGLFSRRMRPQDVRSTNLAWTYGIERPMFAGPVEKLTFIVLMMVAAMLASLALIIITQGKLFKNDEEAPIGDLA